MKKKILVLGLILSLFLTGCNNDNSKDNKDEVKETKTAEVAENATDIPTEVNEVLKMTDKGAKVKVMELFATSGEIFENATGSSTKAKEFLTEHEDMFPSTSEKYGEFLNEELEYKHFVKNIQDVGDELFKVYGGVVNIETSDLNDESKITTIHLLVDNNSYYFVYFGDVPDVYQEDYVTVVGQPYAGASFSNVSGGTTNVIVATATEVVKTQ